MDLRSRTGTAAQSPAEARRALRLVGRIFLPVGLVLLAAGAWATRRQVRIIKNWPSVQGVVKSARIEHSLSHDMQRNSASDMYEAKIVFSYEANGRQYTTEAGAGYSTSSYKEMKKIVDDFPPGSSHTIVYDPSDPKAIRFNAGYSLGFFLLPLIFTGLGAVFTAVGALLLRAARAQPPPDPLLQ